MKDPVSLIATIVVGLLGIAASWRFARHFHIKSRIGTYDIESDWLTVNCPIDEAWNALISLESFGYLYWTHPTVPDGAEIAAGLEVNESPTAHGGLIIVACEPPRRLRFGTSEENWLASIDLTYRSGHTAVCYSRRFLYEDASDEDNEALRKRIVANDIQRLGYVFRDLRQRDRTSNRTQSTES